MSKRQLIMDTAIELFAEKGYEATSIQEITKHCGISKGAFYLDFKSKDELILAIIDYIISNFGTKIDRVVNSAVDGEHKLFLYYSSIFEFVNSHRSFALIFSQSKSTKRVSCVRLIMSFSTNLRFMMSSFHTRSLPCSNRSMVMLSSVPNTI